MDALTKKLNLLMSNCQDDSSSSRTILSCETCGGGHGVAQCLIVSSVVAPMEQVDYVGEDVKEIRVTHTVIPIT